jgi:hypothetical protein
MAAPSWNSAGVIRDLSGAKPAATVVFSLNVPITIGSGNAWTPALALDGGGMLHIAWSDDRSGYRRIFYSNSMDSGTTWSSDREIDGTVGAANAYNPAVAVDRTGGPYNGSVYVVWLESSSSTHVYLRRSPDRGASWLPRVQVDSAASRVILSVPALTLDPAGRLFVAWTDLRSGSGFNVFASRSFDGGATWSGEVQVSPSAPNNFNGTLAAWGGYVYLAWQELLLNATATSLWVARTADGGSTWTSTVIDTGAAPSNRLSPQLYTSPNGTVQIIWVARDSSGVESLRASRSTDNGATWSPPQRVDDATNSPLTYRSPRLAREGGVLFAVWEDNRNGDPDIFHTTSLDNGATWGDGVPNNDPRVDDTDSNANPFDDATNQTAPTAASDLYGVYVAWSDQRSGGNYQLYFSRSSYRRVLVTEFQDAPDGAEAVEIAAFAATPISLAGYRIDIDGFALDLSSLGTLSPGQHRVVGDPAWADLVYNITLGDEGGVIRVFDNTGALMDSIAYGQKGTVPDPIAGESVSRHWAGEWYSNDWARTPVPTWRARNSAPAENPDPMVVLNQVLFNPVAPSDAFVELFYLGIGPLNLAGYVIAGNVPYTIPAATVTASNPYFIVRAGDAPALFGSMTLAGDNVYLYNATGSLLDMAGWSSGHTPGTSMARIPDGFGGHGGFDDPSSIAAGWRFDVPPTIPLVVLRKDQKGAGDLGQVVSYPLTVLHRESAADVLEIGYTPGPDRWSASFVDNATGAPLLDHDGDGRPDTGLLAPGVPFAFDVHVQIPSVGPVADTEATVVSAQARGDPFARGAVTLTTGTPPRIEPSASVDRNPVYVVGSPPRFVTQTNLTLTIAGRGTAWVRRAPQDTVLLLDRSGSLADLYCPGCFALLKDASKTYVANLTIPDQAAVIYFNDNPIPKGPLTTNYALVMSEIDSEVAPGGWTAMGDGLHAANAEMSAHGIPTHFWAIILFTDGNNNWGTHDPLSEARISASLGIRVFTIGLGPDADAALLQNIAAITGGQYLHADRAADLYSIYAKIGTEIVNLAGYDSDLTDDVPMVQIQLPPYVIVPTGPYTDPATGRPRPPDWRSGGPSGTVLQWNVSALHLNQTWSVHFPIRSTQAGVVDILQMPGSRAEYQRWDGTTVIAPFPRVPLTVLEPARVRYTITRSPLGGTPAVDGVTVDGRWYTAPAVFDWWPGETHTIGVPGTNVSGQDSRYLLNGWDDGGAPTHGIVAESTDTIITARFWVQVRPTVHLLGTSPAHDVGVASVFAGAAAAARASGTWSDWVDVGTSLAFDRLAAGSGPDERWITLEDFAVAPWAAVASPFARDVLYYHQFTLRVTVTGLVPQHPAPLSSTAFGRTATASVSASWAGWIDESTDAGIAPLVMVSARERYRTGDVVSWKGDAPHTGLVRYVHEMYPSVRLLGTDDRHVVGLSVAAPSGDRLVDGLSGEWSDWVEVGATLAFDNRTSGSPARAATDATAFEVQTPFNATIHYAAPIETNLKPFFSAVYVAVLVALGVGVAWRWPIPFAGRRRKERERPADVRRRVARDRRKTALLIVAPMAVLEAAVGTASYFTGVLRIPDQGVWLSLGLTMNTIILAAGVGGQLVARSRGYDADKALAEAERMGTSGPEAAAPPPPDEHDEEQG